MQECRALQSDVDERSLHAWQHAQNPALVDITDQSPPRSTLNVDLLQNAVLKQCGAHLTRGDVYQDFFF